MDSIQEEQIKEVICKLDGKVYIGRIARELEELDKQRKKLRKQIVAFLRSCDKLYQEEDNATKRKLNRYVTDLSDARLVRLAVRYSDPDK